MKSALKKVLSLMLVAMLLVSAIPFQASAVDYIEPIQPATPSEAGNEVENDVNDTDIDVVDDTDGEPEGQADIDVIQPETPETPKDDNEEKDPMDYVELIEAPDCSIYVTVSDGSKVLVTNYKLGYKLTKSDLEAQFEELTGKAADVDGAGTEVVGSNEAAEFLLSDVAEVVSIPDSYKISKTICKLDGKSLLVSIAGSSWQDGEGNPSGGNSGNTGNTGTNTPATPSTPNTPDDGTTDSKNTIKVKLLFNESQNVGESFTYTIKDGKSVSIRALLKAWDTNWNDDYKFVRANNDRLGRTTDIDDTVRVADEYINIRLSDRKSSDPDDTEPTSGSIKLRVMFNDSTTADESYTYNTTKSVSIKTILNAWYGDWSKEYTFKRADVDDVKTTNVNKAVKPGQTVYVRLYDKESGSTGSTGTNKFPYKVYLHIYLNNKVDEPAKNVNISDGIAVDGVVSKREVESVVKQYYSAKNSDGIKYDGLYLAQGNWVSNFANDLEKYDEITGILDMRQESEVHINVMVTNANAKSSSNNSNSTNPKTGDSIVMTVSALGITASALAAAYYVSKKRMAK